MPEDLLTEEPIQTERRGWGVLGRLWGRVFGGKSAGVRPILPGDRVEQKNVVQSPIADQVVEVAPAQEQSENIGGRLGQQRELAMQDLLRVPVGEEILSLRGAVRHLEMSLPQIVDEPERQDELKEELEVLGDFLTQSEDRAEALSHLDRLMQDLFLRRGEDLILETPGIYREASKIELLIDSIRRQKLHKAVVVRDDSREVEVEQQSLGKRFVLRNGIWQQVEGEDFVRSETPWQYGFMDVDKLTSCLSREKDSIRATLGTEHLGWLKDEVEVSFDKFRLQGRRDEDVYLGMYIADDLEELFLRAWQREGVRTGRRESPGTLEMLFYRGILKILSKGKGKLMPRANIGQGYTMYNESNDAGGERRVYFVDLGRIDGDRAFVLVGGCRKPDQQELFKRIN